MTAYDYVQLSASLRFAYYPYDKSFSWLNIEKNGEWEKVIFPSISFPGENNLIAHESTNPITEKIELAIGAFLDSERKKRASRILYENAFDKLEEFCHAHAPWAKTWEIITDEEQYSYLESHYVREVLGVNAPSNIQPFIIAHLLTTPFLTHAQLYKTAFDDGFYTCSNIDAGWDIIQSSSIKTGLLKATGVCSKPLMRALQEYFSTHENIFIDEFIIQLKMCRGLPSEYVEQALKESIINPRGVSYTMQVDGVRMEGDNVYIPDWVLNQPPHRRLSWLKDLPIYHDAVTMSAHIDMNKVNTRKNSIREVHNDIVAQYYSSVEANVDMNHYGRMANKAIRATCDTGTHILEVKALSSPAELNIVGSQLGVCLGSPSYSQRLKEDLSSFFVCVDDSSQPIAVAEVDNTYNTIVELRGYLNEIPQEEDAISSAILELVSFP